MTQDFSFNNILYDSSIPTELSNIIPSYNFFMTADQTSNPSNTDFSLTNSSFTLNPVPSSDLFSTTMTLNATPIPINNFDSVYAQSPSDGTSSDDNEDEEETSIKHAKHKVEEQTVVRRAKQFRYSAQDRIDLLKEVCKFQPFDSAHGDVKANWEKVAAAFRANRPKAKDVKGASVARTFDSMLKVFKAGERASLRKSGCEEEYDELERLMTDIVDLSEEAIKRKKESKEEAAKKVETEEKKGERMRERAMQSLRNKAESETESSDKKRRKSVHQGDGNLSANLAEFLAMKVQKNSEKEANEEKKTEIRLLEAKARLQEANNAQEQIKMAHENMLLMQKNFMELIYKMTERKS